MSSPQRMSDTERSEKPVRERLRNASIADASTSDGSAQPVQTTEEHLRLPPKGIDTTGPDGSTIAKEDMDHARPSRKRSHEDMADSEPVDEPAPKTRHGRKRSRELVDEASQEEISPKRKISGEQPRHVADKIDSAQQPALEPAVSNIKRAATPATDNHGAASTEDKASPKTKKSRSEESEKAHSALAPPPAEPVVKPSVDAGKSAIDEKKPEEQQNEEVKPSSIPTTSGFANASASSPFGALAACKSSTDSQTSTSAFKASGFGALSGSSASAFGSLTSSAPKLSSFASPGTTSAFAATEAKTTENDKPTTTTFGGTLGASSAFAATGHGATPAFAGSGAPSAFSGIPGSTFSSTGKSAFGSGLGGGFGGLSGSKLGSFASSGTPGVIGSAAKSVKLFGADDDDADDGSGGEEEDNAEESKAGDDDEKDQRFFAQDIETGEEEESTEYTCRAKLYNFVKAEDGTKKEWKERGLGVVRLNVRYSGPENPEAAPKARLVMRADGSHRVALNTPVLKGVKFGSVTGEAPVGGYIYFMGSIDGSAKLELLQMKLRQQFALELYDRIVELQKAM